MAESDLGASRGFGVVLAGGEARRFGADKALAPFGGLSLIERAVAAGRAGGMVSVVVSGRGGDEARRHGADGGLDDPASPVGSRQGPLAGVVAGLDAAAAAGSDVAVVWAVDAPLVPARLLADLAAQAVETGRAMVVAVPDGGFEPLPVAVPVGSIAAASLRSFWDRGERRLAGGLAEAGVRQMSVADSSWLASANRVEDLADMAEGLVGGLVRAFSG